MDLAPFAGVCFTVGEVWSSGHHFPLSLFVLQMGQLKITILL
jgi:hypothetical protein